MKTTKGGKVMNPTDAYRKELRKRELKRNKKERKKVREVGILKKDPEQIKDQIQKLEVMKAEGALDKARKHKKRQLEDTLNLVLKKRKEYEDKVKEKGEAPVMFSHLGPPPRRRTTAEEEDMVKHPKPEDSVYYHPTLNPTGAPPPGKPPMFKSSIGPRIPMSEASSSGAASSSMPEEDGGLPTSSLPSTSPLALPYPNNNADPVDGSMMPPSLPLLPPPPMPPKPEMTNLDTSLPPPLPPPPSGPPPNEHAGIRSSLPPPPPPPPVHQSVLSPPPGIGGNELGKGYTVKTEEPASMESPQGSSILPPPPPPPRLPLKSEGTSSENDSKPPTGTDDMLRMAPPPPPPRQQQPFVPGPALIPSLQPDVLPPGISRFPPPPPPTEMGLPPHGIVGQHPPLPPGVMVVPLIPRPPYGPPLMMRPPLPPGPPPMPPYDGTTRPLASQKPSYIKSAASTVVKRPLAQHTPELTAMVPASVRVKRESTQPKPKPKGSTTVVVNQPTFSRAAVKQERSSSAQPKPQSIDDSYMAFLEDMKALGALDGK
ncbi:unnamed protein product [Cuscuta campestris]|uniref:Wbp11/ELF5/Saf1 N-terminal domain-containing protein n=1 Tax=Cuscuta campestris TaxID=132261 RepID=A0A484LJ99_9ASTE|nr:unnamed protein product [Cuscuta campestris]